MKILVLTNLYPPHHIGGYELICQTVVDELRKRRCSVTLLTSDHGTTPAESHTQEADVNRGLKINGLYGHPWLGIRALRWLERHNNQLLRLTVERIRPDVVYVWNMGGLSKSMLFTLQALGIPTVFYISDHWIVRGLPADVWLRWWNRTDLSPARRLVRAVATAAGVRRRWQGWAPTNPISHLQFRRIYFCSRALRELTAKAGYDVSHAAVIYPPIHERYVQPPPRPVPAAIKRLLYVGRLSEDKGVMTALRALALLRGKFQCQLSVYGQGDPDYVARLKHFARERQLDMNLTSGSLDQMPAIYRQHDLLLFPSEWAEPFALTPLEAMASGLPVIGTTTGGSAELFRDRENALTYTAGKADELAECIWEFASDHRLRSSCSQTGCEEARTRYAAPVVVDQIEQYLRETLEQWRAVPLPHYGARASLTPALSHPMGEGA